MTEVKKDDTETIERSVAARAPWRYALMGMALPLVVIGVAAAWHFHPSWMEALAQNSRASAQAPAAVQSLGQSSAQNTAQNAAQTTAQAGAKPTTDAVAAPNESPFLVQARQAEANTCAGVYQALGTVAVEGSQFATQAIWSKTEADNRAIQGMTGMTYKAGTYVGPAAGVVFASPTGQKCEGIMVRVVPFQQSCEAVSALLPKGSAASSKLSDVAVYNATDPGLQVMLIPAGTGCTALTILRAGER